MSFRLSQGLMGLCLLATTASFAIAQSPSGATLTGSVADPRGAMLPNASVVVHNGDSSVSRKATSDNNGHFIIPDIKPGRYEVDTTASGFAANRKLDVVLSADHTADVAITLSLGDVSEEVTVEAYASDSVAAQLAPMDARLDERSARTEITDHFLQNFTSPVADFGEAVQLAPGTFTTNGNGVGLGQSNTYFRGFSDGSYDIDFDGIPFYDTNTPSHHSWAFFPSQFLGGVDFDRSPGTASTIGPTPFGGSIHLLSKRLPESMNLRGGVSYGSFNTILYDGEFDSGNFGPHKRANLQLDIHHLQSDGYQTFNYQTRNGGELKAQYKFSDRTYVTGFSGVIWLDANTPNFKATRCQMYGSGSGYSCAGVPFAGSGINFLMTNNSDPTNYLDYQYNTYHVPTDFEYVGFHSELGRSFIVDVKPYTYNYDNAERYSNAVTITETGPAACNLDLTVKKLTHKALTCGVDKYNSYRKYGETGTLSQVSNLGILRAGLWFEHAATNRHQYPSDPLNNWKDDPLPNFAEQFWTNSYQPFIEYEFHVLPKLNITPGVKWAQYTIDLTQHADNGKTIGDLGGGGDPSLFVKNHGSYFATLPSIDANYRVMTNWSVYGQLATGSIVPPSGVYDFNQTPTTANPHPGLLTPPKQQRSTTLQFGSVLKLKRLTVDADFYHIRFQNSYSSLTDPTTGEQVNFLQPSSISKGFEAETNVNFGHGLGAYFNATVGRATYTGTLNVAGTLASAPQLAVAAPSGLWVANTPSDTEAEGVTYQKRSWDVAFFNKRVGTMYQDNGAYHNQATIDPFNVSNTFVNYTIRNGSRFNQTKIRLSFNNIFNQHNITSDNISGTALTRTIAANNTTYVDPFNTNGPTPAAGGDQIGVLPARSIMLSVTFGLSPKR